MARAGPRTVHRYSDEFMLAAVRRTFAALAISTFARSCDLASGRNRSLYPLP